MASPVLGLRLLTRLGPEACEDLSNAIEEGQNDMLAEASERFEQRLIAVAAELRADIGRGGPPRQDMTTMDAGIRVALTEGLSKIRVEMRDMRVDVLRDGRARLGVMVVNRHGIASEAYSLWLN